MTSLFPALTCSASVVPVHCRATVVEPSLHPLPPFLSQVNLRYHSMLMVSLISVYTHPSPESGIPYLKHSPENISLLKVFTKAFNSEQEKSKDLSTTVIPVSGTPNPTHTHCALVTQPFSLFCILYIHSLTRSFSPLCPNDSPSICVFRERSSL